MQNRREIEGVLPLYARQAPECFSKGGGEWDTGDSDVCPLPLRLHREGVGQSPLVRDREKIEQRKSSPLPAFLELKLSRVVVGGGVQP